jgi:hypothetical protein
MDYIIIKNLLIYRILVLFTSIDNFVANDTTTTSETHESFQNGYWWKKYVFWSTIFATNPRAGR